MMFVSGAKTIADEYNCNGAILRISRFFRRKRFASFKKDPSMDSSVDLIGLAIVQQVIGIAYYKEVR